MSGGGDTSPLGGFLSGIRVIDLSQYIPGPMATLFLADMGAEVIKIEPPQGDQMQSLGPRDPEGRPTYYRALNAGKAIRRMNLKDEATRRDFLELVRGADIVVEGFRPGVMDRLGIGWDVLSRLNPGLILCSISGYGANSRAATKAGHDANYLAMMGVAHRNGSDAPSFYDPPFADSAGSLFSAMTILGALQGRARTGLGCAVDVALADTVMPLQLIQVADFGATGDVPDRGANYLNGGAAYYQVYATSDGAHVVLGAVEPKFWANFCEAAGRPDLVDRHGEAMPQTALMDSVARLFAGLTLAEAEAMFGHGDCCFSPVNDLGAALSEEQIADRRLVAEAPDGSLQCLFPAWVDGQPPDLRGVIDDATPLASPRWDPAPEDELIANKRGRS